jgi:hypothetical protein
MNRHEPGLAGMGKSTYRFVFPETIARSLCKPHGNAGLGRGSRHPLCAGRKVDFPEKEHFRERRCHLPAN